MEPQKTPSPNPNNQIVLRDLLLGSTQLAKPSAPVLSQPPPKPQQTVLEEDEYLKHLEAIIKRDYFPDLARLEAYKEYQARKAAGEENVRIPTILIKRTPLDASKKDPLAEGRAKPAPPSVEETKGPSSTIDTANMSLDEYLRKYTSEDNKSFEKLFDRQKAELEQKQAWMRRQADIANRDLLALQAANSDAVKSIQYDRDKYVKPDVQFAICESKSSLFFAPKDIEQPSMVIANPFVAEGLAIPPKEIAKQNTRLPSTFVLSQVQLEKTMKEKPQEKSEGEGYYGEIGGLKTPDLLGYRRKENESITTLDRVRNLKELKARHQEAPNETPAVKGYKFVKPQSYHLLDLLSSPIMTWGEVASEPVLLGPATFSLESVAPKEEPGETQTEPKATFEVPQAPERERISHELVNKAKKRKTEEKLTDQERKRLNSARSTYKRVTDLSEPGQRLLQQNSGRRIGSIFAGTGGSRPAAVATPKLPFPPSVSKK